MKPKTPTRLVTVLVILVLAYSSGGSLGFSLSQNKDIMVGAAVLIKRPQNPSTQRRGARRNESSGARPVKIRPDSATEKPDKINESVEDALELGNAARDRKPPDLESAEMAYRLAWKLNPKEARALIGLGNVYFDQKRYSEAALAYREALKLGEQSRGFLAFGTKGATTSTVSKASTSQDESASATLNGYLAASLMENGELAGAERHLLKSIQQDPENGEWQGLLGFNLYQQGRFTESLEFLTAAVKLAPENFSYQDIQREAERKARINFSSDALLTRSLEATGWKVSGPGNAHGRCDLKPAKLVQCTPPNANIISAESWRVLDGFLHLTTRSEPAKTCIGRIEPGRIALRCRAELSDKHEIWTQVMGG